MDLLRVAGATLNQTPLDFEGNRKRIVAAIEEAQALGVELLCLPELAVTGYGCEDAFFSLETAKRADESLKAILPKTKGIAVVIGLPHFYYGAMYNAAAVVQDGKVLGLNAKRVLPKEGVHYEPRWFRPWPFGRVAETTCTSVRVPFGDLRYRLGGIGVAIEICEEAWDSVPASAVHADAVDLVLNPSASHFALGKYAKRENLVANSSRALQVTYVYSNLVGLEGGRVIYDGGVFLAEGGEIVTRGPRFSYKDHEITWRDINPELARVAKLKGKPVREPMEGIQGTAYGVFSGVPGGSGGASYGTSSYASPEIAGADPHQIRASAKPALKALVSAPRIWPKEEEFLRATTLGLFDYMRKCRAQGFVLSLSGGVDSAATAVLVAQMFAIAFQELGADVAWRRLGLAGPAPSSSRDAVTKHLLCIYQRTANSGAVTQTAARNVAAALGAAFHDADVSPLVEAYVERATTILGRPLTWANDDMALQNIQARARAPLAWLIANALGFLLLTTGNRSEAAMGYATMDGDTAGGLAPLGGIDKHFLRSWLVWAETECALGLGKIAALNGVNAQEPTAELRPRVAGAKEQTDEADLMPYAVLTRIERYFVRDHLGPDDILRSLALDFPEIAAATLAAHMQRFFTLWSQNQWKRERLAPSFHVDDLSLDPKTWCRYPILSVPYKMPGV